MLEPLETRALLSITVSLDNGLLLIQGTSKDDVITVDAANDQVIVAMNTLTFSTLAADVKLIRIMAGGGNDRVIVTSAVQAKADLYGEAGNDYLQADDRGCRLYGGPGNDTLVAGLGQDVLSGGPGIDKADYSARTTAVKVTLDGKANDGAPGERDNVMADVENVTGGSGNDCLVGNAARNTLIGGDGNDTLIGGAGDDVLVGGAGSDSMVGGEGDDLFLAIDLSAGDTIDGGNGYDSYAIDSVSGVRDTVLNVENELSVLST